MADLGLIVDRASRAKAGHSSSSKADSDVSATWRISIGSTVGVTRLDVAGPACAITLHSSSQWRDFKSPSRGHRKRLRPDTGGVN